MDDRQMLARDPHAVRREPDFARAVARAYGLTVEIHAGRTSFHRRFVIIQPPFSDARIWLESRAAE